MLQTKPLVHCITNYVTVNDCANVLLACGASPVMADDEREVEDIVSISNALYINIGTLNARTVNAMLRAGKKANALNIPVILDPVGAGASRLRTEAALQLLENIRFDIIKGNISEIKNIAGSANATKGVDASDEDKASPKNAALLAKELALKTKSVILISGPLDIISDGEKTLSIANGHEYMGRVCGSGCMLGALCAAFRAEFPSLDAAVCATAAFGVAGERAFKNQGLMSYRNNLIDAVGFLTPETVQREKKIETLTV
ncbi:MAG: hydroxyethylthiazole kinase [Elusimicrobiota bacterium]|jgi:hydroxyethylthiazole kinase|nr:hydroxyethylthiazole kinase [Elusimicrobiota bacterium]